ncbi:MAG: hypothetical protein IJI24_09730 [Lachnospiraceae bacterium]|nr:hypothetical protein [Lachnospiraceae bacterium]
MKKRTTENSKQHTGLRGIMTWFAIFLILYFIYAVPVRGRFEPPSDTVETSVDGTCSNAHIREVLKRYPIFRGVWFGSIKEDTFVMPGLKSARTLSSNEDTRLCACTSMTPQGICVAKDYLLISAYCHTHSHNSVIYVMDLETKAFVKEIVLPGKSHVGGIAYDPIHRYIWVTGYSEEEERASVAAFSYETMESYSLDEKCSPIGYALNYPIITQLRASFMTWHNESLYIGYFTSTRKIESYVQEFKIGENGGLITRQNTDAGSFDLMPQVALPSAMFRISRLCQGIAFIGDEIVLSQSIGIFRSTMRRYRYKEGNLEESFDARNRYADLAIRLPAMLEQIAVDSQGRMYLTFESAAYAYRYWPKETVDRVVVLNNYIQTQELAAGVLS